MRLYDCAVHMAIDRSILPYRISCPSLGGSNIDFHYPDCSYEDEGGEYRIRGLVEGGILHDMVVDRYKGCEREQEDDQSCLLRRGFVVAKCGEEHDARRVDHGELIYKLHWV